MFWHIALLFSIFCALELTLAQVDNSANGCYNSAPRYLRTLVKTRDGGTPTNTLTDVLDAGHAKMLGVGGYTQADVDALEAEAYDYFLSQFGLNFTGAPDYPPLAGVAKYILIGAAPALLVPYGTSAAAGAQYKVAFDSNYVERGDGTWVVREFGMAVSLQGPGVIPGGERQGDLFLTGDVLVYNHYNYLKVGGNYSDPNCNCREVVKIQTYTPARTVPNTNNLTDTIIKLSIQDSAGNSGEGFVLVSLSYSNAVPPTTQQTIRAVLTWVCDTVPNTYCPATVPQPQPEPAPQCEPCSSAGFTFASMIGFLFIILVSIF